MKALSSIIFLLLLAGAVTAISADEETVSFPVSEVSDLVSVSNNINPSEVLPGYEYVYELYLDWNISESALSKITADAVSVYVLVEPSSNESAVYFRNEDGLKVGSSFAKLECFVEDGDCSNESTLSRTVEVYYTVPFNETITEDSLRVYSSFDPLVEDEAVINESESALEAALEKLNTAMNEGLNVTDEENLMESAMAKFDDGDFETARELSDQVIAELTTVLDSTGAPPEQEAGASGQTIQNVLSSPVDSNGLVLLVAVGLLVAIAAAFLHYRGGKSKGMKPRKGPGSHASLEEEDLRSEPTTLDDAELVGSNEDIELHDL